MNPELAPKSEPGTPLGGGTNVGVSDSTVEIPVYVPEQEQLEASVSHEWQAEKQKASLLSPVANVIDRVKIFYAGKAIQRAEKAYQRIEKRSTRTETKGQELETMIANSKNTESVIDTVRQATGLGDASLETQTIRKAQMEQAQGKMDKIRESLSREDEKLSEIKQKKEAFEKVRDEAKERVISRFQAQVDREQDVLSGIETSLATSESSILTCADTIAEFEIQHKLLQEELGKAQLPAFAQELRRVSELVAFKMSQEKRMKAGHVQQHALLSQQKMDAERRRDQWQAKIAPPKKQEPVAAAPEQTSVPEREQTAPVSTEKSSADTSVPLGQPEAPVAEPLAGPVEKPPVPEVVTSPQPVTAQETKPVEAPSGNEKTESVQRPKALIDTVIGFKREFAEMTEDESGDLTRVLQATQKAYERKHPESKVFKWIFWMLEFFTDSKEKKKKSSTI